jgi:hypothetical protein
MRFSLVYQIQRAGRGCEWVKRRSNAVKAAFFSDERFLEQCQDQQEGLDCILAAQPLA